MAGLQVFYSMHPMWVWLAVGALFLAVEVATGSGYLLWPAASAGLVAVLTSQMHVGLPLELVIFAALTIASTYLGRRFLPPTSHRHGPDINDKASRLVGRTGETVGLFAAGQGRVFGDGAEWSAELAAEQPEPTPGARVEVMEVLGGGRLKVRPA
jgi:membrane protein implicated in regulation of membrane protease activity